MATIPLSKGKWTIIDDDDVLLLSEHKWCFDGRYATRRKQGKKIYLHRELLNPPKGFICDHVNGLTLDNRRCNLRVSTYQQNGYNSSGKNGKLGVKGVCLTASGTYCAFIKYNRRSINLGTFKTIEEAKAAYNGAAMLMAGEFARTE